MWKRLQKKLTIKPTYGTPVRKPRDSQLDRFEAEYEFKLPKSYREFVKLFGAGMLDGYFRIYSPAHGGRVETLDLAAELEEFRTDGLELFQGEFPKYRDFIARMIMFSSTINGETVVWDPTEVTNRRNCEYKIYVIPRDIGEEIEHLADTFRDYIEGWCLGQESGRVFNWSDREPEFEFVPFGRDWPEPS